MPHVRRRPPSTLGLGLALLGSLALPALAANPPELAAEQLAIDRTSNTGVGDTMNQELAQVFQLHDSGYLTHLMLPLNCMTAPMPTLRVTIQPLRYGLPSGKVLASQDLPGYVLDTFPAAGGELGLRMVQFERPAWLKPGSYAFTISGIGGLCQLWYGLPGDSYTGGAAYLSTVPGSVPGQPKSWNFPLGRDLAFQLFQQP